MGIVIALALFGALFVSDNHEFFDQAAKDMDAGNTWHYVGKQPLDPSAKSLPLKVEGEDPYILWKLKKD